MSIAPPRPPRLAGGAFIAFGLIGGTIAGIVRGQPVVGLLAGFGIGLVLALGVWLYDRRRV